MINLFVRLDGFAAHICLDVLDCLDEFHGEEGPWLILCLILLRNAQ